MTLSTGAWLVVWAAVGVMMSVAPVARGDCPKDSTIEVINSLTELVELCKIPLPAFGPRLHLPASVSRLQGLRHLNLRGGRRLAVATMDLKFGELTKLTFLDLGRNSDSEDIYGTHPFSEPDVLPKLTNLETLFLPNAGVRSVSHEWAALSNLRTLDLRDNFMRTVPTNLLALSNLESLDLSGNRLGLQEYPDNFNALTGLKHLDLSFTSTSRLTANFTGMTRLESLRIVGTGLRESPTTLGALSGLTSLDMSANYINSVPDSLGALTNLQVLKLHWSGGMQWTNPIDLSKHFDLEVVDLSRTPQGTIPASLLEIPNLKDLNLERTSLTTVAKEIASLTSLRVLKLNSNLFTKLPSSIGALSHLTSLDLRSGSLKALPSSIGKLNKTIDLAVNWLSLKLPKSIENLEKPRTLSLQTNTYNNPIPKGWCGVRQLQHITVHGSFVKLPRCFGSMPNLESFTTTSNTGAPNDLGNLKNIKKLTMAWEGIAKGLTQKLGELSKLETLTITGGLETLPSSFARLTNLKSVTLSLQYNKRFPRPSVNIVFDGQLPKQIGNLRKLTHLSLSGTRLKRLPESFTKLRLPDLNLSGQGLEKLPTSLGRMVQLTSLNLADNDIAKLPESIGKLSLLQRFNFRRNALASLPSTFDRLSSLATLDLANNKLEALPPTLGQLSLLQHVDLHNNKLVQLPNLSLLTQLTFLSVGGNQLGQMPQGLSNLTSLDISSNLLQDLTASLPRLTFLDASNNAGLTLDRDALQLPELQTLSLRNSSLTSKALSIDFSAFKSLQSVDLSGNMITSVPPGLDPASVDVDLTGNMIYVFPQGFDVVPQRSAPDQRNWEQCLLINTRKSKSKSKCQKNKSCIWCDNGVGCRPTNQWHNQGALPVSQACDNRTLASGVQMSVGEADAVVELFPQCPSPTEMTGCVVRNQALKQGSSSTKRRKCESAFAFTFQNARFNVGKRRCFFSAGICRPAGDYFASRQAIASLAVDFGGRGCPSLAVNL